MNGSAGIMSFFIQTAVQKQMKQLSKLQDSIIFKKENHINTSSSHVPVLTTETPSLHLLPVGKMSVPTNTNHSHKDLFMSPLPIVIVVPLIMKMAHAVQKLQTKSTERSNGKLVRVYQVFLW